MKYVLVLFLIFPRLMFAQYYFDFENNSGTSCSELPGSWEQVPAERWGCDTGRAIEGAASLHHMYDNPGSGCDYLIFTHDRVMEDDSLVLSFKVRHGYPPSAANNWQVALTASFTGDATIFNGLVLGVNFQGSDDLLKLWYCEQGNCREICSTSFNYQESVGTEQAIRIRLVRDPVGTVNIACFPEGETGNPVWEGSCTLNRLPGGRQLVIRYEYSAAQDRKLWMDQLSLQGSFVRDTLPPHITGAGFTGDNCIYLDLSEEMDRRMSYNIRVELCAAICGDCISGDPCQILEPDSLTRDGARLSMWFPVPIPNREAYQLRIGGICDMDGNCLPDTLINIMRNEAEWGDVVLNELLSDPEPAVRLPAEEFVELFNRSSYPVTMEGWHLEVNNRSYLVADTLLGAGDYLVLSGIQLPNSGAEAALISDRGVIIHAIRYGIPWDGAEWKKEGGWSLESPDPDRVCMNGSVWEYSNDPSGGTPGRINSNDADLDDPDPPVMLSLGYAASNILTARYTEPMLLSATGLEQFVVQPGNIHPVRMLVPGYLTDQIELVFDLPVQERSSYSLQMPPLPDCEGNLSNQSVWHAGALSVPVFGSILINEIMYDPEEGEPEFIELYLPGSAYFDLQDLALHVTGIEGSPDHPFPLAEQSTIIFPGDYLIATRSVGQLRAVYHLDPSGCWIEVPDLPEMKNGGGTIYLTDRAGAVIDMTGYSDEMHMEGLNSRGVSLERISSERPGNDPGNWHSAASIEGYATPGKVNSQSEDAILSDELLTVEPKVFSPDMDGYQDLLKINLFTRSSGWVIRLWITDLTGLRVRTLANNHIGGPFLTYTWDGEDDHGGLVAGGIYVIHLAGYLPVTGEKQIRRVPVGVIYR